MHPSGTFPRLKLQTAIYSRARAGSVNNRLTSLRRSHPGHFGAVSRSTIALTADSCTPLRTWKVGPV
jgi:hypothetical protein